MIDTGSTREKTEAVLNMQSYQCATGWASSIHARWPPDVPLTPAQRLELALRPYQFALDAVRTTEKQRRAGGTGLARHATDAGGSEAGQVKAMEQVIQWGELDLDLVRRRARAVGVLEQFERLLAAAWEESEE